MDLVNGSNAAKLASTYTEADLTGTKKITEKELSYGIAPSAKAAFSRKPYDNASAAVFKRRPVLR